jgi:hypothetical protein
VYGVRLTSQEVASRYTRVVMRRSVDADTPAAAIEAGHRLFQAFGAELRADGFRITRRGSEVIYAWCSDPDNDPKREEMQPDPAAGVWARAGSQT